MLHKSSVRVEKDHVVHYNKVGPVEPVPIGKAKYILMVIVKRSKLSKVYII